LTNLWQALFFLSSIIIFQLKFTNLHVHIITCNKLTTDIKQHYTIIILPKVREGHALQQMLASHWC
jgi:hypothetical protein